MYQPKVKNTQTKFDGQGDRTVVEGHLVFIKQDRLPELGDLVDHGNNGYTVISDDEHLDFALSFHDDEGYVPVKPAITSIIERPEVGDWVYDREDNTIFKSKKEQDFNSARFLKVLAIPEHFSGEHILDILDGNIKDGDVVYLQYDKGGYRHAIHMDSGTPPDPEGVYLDQNNHIILFPIQSKEKVYTLEFREGNPITSMTVLVGEDLEFLESYIQENKDFQKDRNWWWVILEGYKNVATGWKIHSTYTCEGEKVDNQPVPVKKPLEEAAKEYADNKYKDGGFIGYTSCIEDFKAGAEWAKNNGE